MEEQILWYGILVLLALTLYDSLAHNLWSHSLCGFSVLFNDTLWGLA